jgi:hypothetical protein
MIASWTVFCCDRAYSLEILCVRIRWLGTKMKLENGRFG